MAEKRGYRRLAASRAGPTGGCTPRFVREDRADGVCYALSSGSAFYASALVYISANRSLMSCRSSFDHGETRCLDASLDLAALTVDQLELG